MFEYTAGNHFQFGYNGEFFTSRSNREDQWTVKYGQSSRPTKSFRQEAKLTAGRIRDTTDLPIYVLLSGGRDSEVALRAFVDAGIPVTALIARFANDLNVHDIAHGIVACEQLNAPYKIIDLDILLFWEVKARVLAEQVRSCSSATLLLMWLIDVCDGFPVIGGGDCYLEREGSVWHMLERESWASLYRHLIHVDRGGVPGFFQYSPELMLSFLKDPTIWDVCAFGRPSYRQNTATVKAKMLQQHYPDMVPRKKYTGYENVIPQMMQLSAHLDKEHGDHSGVVRTSYNDLLLGLEHPERSLYPGYEYYPLQIVQAL